MSPCKMINLVFENSKKLFTKNVDYLERGISQGYDIKISRHFVSFMVDSAQLKFKNH